MLRDAGAMDKITRFHFPKTGCDCSCVEDGLKYLETDHECNLFFALMTTDITECTNYPCDKANKGRRDAVYKRFQDMLEHFRDTHDIMRKKWCM